MPPTPDANTNPTDCPNCAAPNECCEINGSSFCIPTTSDALNCGGCGISCMNDKADSCGGSQCKCGFGPECGVDESCCADGCKNFMTDEQNCGGCGPTFACGAGATCEAGVCSCGGSQCQPGEMCCGDVCTNTMTDPLHCGGCTPTNVCSGMTSSCNNGVCGCPGGGGTCPTMMPGGFPVVAACCGTGCVDLCAATTDCGACGAPCAAGDFCFLGGCFTGGGEPLEACQPF